MTGVSAREVKLVNSSIIDAFVKAFQAYRDPGDGFRECVRAALTEVAPMIAAKALEASGVAVITEDKLAAQDLYSAATCGLSTLIGLNVAEGCRMQFIRGVLKRHAKYGPDAALTAALKATP